MSDKVRSNEPARIAGQGKIGAAMKSVGVTRTAARADRANAKFEEQFEERFEHSGRVSERCHRRGSCRIAQRPMILYDSTGKPHVIVPAYPEPPEPPELPVALYRVQGFDVALEDRPEGVLATVADTPRVTATADMRSEVFNLIREQLAPLWKPSPAALRAPVE